MVLRGSTELVGWRVGKEPPDLVPAIIVGGGSIKCRMVTECLGRMALSKSVRCWVWSTFGRSGIGIEFGKQGAPAADCDG